MDRFDDYLAEIAKVRQQLDARIVGQDDLKTSLIVSVFAGGMTPGENTHILLRSVPGLGKTETAKAFAGAFSLVFRRIQFKSDDMPKDFFFSYEQDLSSAVWKKHKGAIYTNILLVDEINRAHPDTHSGLLEAMAEGQFTEQGETVLLPQPFMVIGTFNPVEQKGTYSFLEALKDRVTMQINIPYPSPRELGKIREMHERGAFPEIHPVMGARQIFEIRKVIQEEVEVSERVKRFIEGHIQASRPEHNHQLKRLVKLGLSPRGAIWLTRVSKVAAFLANRTYVIPADVERYMVPVLMHRIILADELAMTMEPIDLQKELGNVAQAIIRQAAVYAKEG